MRFACRNDHGNNTYTHSQYTITIIDNNSGKYLVVRQNCNENPFFNLHDNTEQFILLTNTSAPTTIKYKCFHGNSGYENAPQVNVAHTLSSLFRLLALKRIIAEKSIWKVRQNNSFYYQLNPCWSAFIYASLNYHTVGEVRLLTRPIGCLLWPSLKTLLIWV
jgi:hypothetical protein